MEKMMQDVPEMTPRTERKVAEEKAEEKAEEEFKADEARFLSSLKEFKQMVEDFPSQIKSCDLSSSFKLLDRQDDSEEDKLQNIELNNAIIQKNQALRTHLTMQQKAAYMKMLQCRLASQLDLIEARASSAEAEKNSEVTALEEELYSHHGAALGTLASHIAYVRRQIAKEDRNIAMLDAAAQPQVVLTEQDAANVTFDFDAVGDEWSF
ncbi:hypothetical protein J8273_7437 [Carpediemonas membranifera]|uniref:Uncharacterized protein n=1 Tax=Carpediemonas membranifera TaxID=201153 RepID=A0A8J6DZS9_9EUKA|nr:hypothetical protein J8273_7437 [Carpediemonas membranifera]|eukprot:KAG9391163.1 hypothetical protein J8273_7437 [Carpediemonas membranifera]